MCVWEDGVSVCMSQWIDERRGNQETPHIRLDVCWRCGCKRMRKIFAAKKESKRLLFGSIVVSDDQTALLSLPSSDPLINDELEANARLNP